MSKKKNYYQNFPFLNNISKFWILYWKVPSENLRKKSLFESTLYNSLSKMLFSTNKLSSTTNWQYSREKKYICSKLTSSLSMLLLNELDKICNNSKLSFWMFLNEIWCESLMKFTQFQNFHFTCDAIRLEDSFVKPDKISILHYDYSINWKKKINIEWFG